MNKNIYLCPIGCTIALDRYLKMCLNSRLCMIFSAFFLSILGVACDDETTGLQPAVLPAGETGAGSSVGGASSSAGTAIPVAGSMMAGQESSAGENAGETTSQCQQSCDLLECAPLSCLCDDGRSVSTEGCVEGCCASAPESESLRSETCDRLCQSLDPAECVIGETRCLEESSAAIQRCNLELEWTIESCESDEVCALGQCLPRGCLEGQTRCLSPTELTVCSGGVWVSGGACQGACSQGICQSFACAQAAADKSYLGCEYVTLEMPNVVNYDSHNPTAVVLTNPSQTEQATIQILGPNGEPTPLIGEQLIPVPMIDGLPPIYTDQPIRSEIKDAQDQVVESSIMRADQVLIPPGGTGTFLLPAARWPEEGSLVKRIAHRVISDLPVGAYQFSPYCCNFSFSNDASLLIPTSTLGLSYRFIGVPSLRGADLRGSFDFPASAVVVATRDQTELRFTLPAQDLIEVETQGRIRTERGAYVVDLDQQEVLYLRLATRPTTGFSQIPQPDLTGAFFESNEPIAVFSGHECSFYPSDTRACDHLEEQLFPTDTWGNEFLLVPPKERGSNAPDELVYWKILAQSDGAQLSLSVPFSELNARSPGSPGVPDCGQLLDPTGQIITLGARGFCEFGTKSAVAISANQGITVLGIISAQNSVSTGSTFGSRLGDPSIFLVPPARQARRDYAFLTPGTYFNDFVTITFSEGTQISLDGQPLDLSAALPISGVDQRYIHVELSDGGHRLEGTNPFSIMVFAYDDFVSYAFTGGLNLSKR